MISGKQTVLYDDGKFKVFGVEGVDTNHLFFQVGGSGVAAFQPNVPALIDGLRKWHFRDAPPAAE